MKVDYGDRIWITASNGELELTRFRPVDDAAITKEIEPWPEKFRDAMDEFNRHLRKQKLAVQNMLS